MKTRILWLHVMIILVFVGKTYAQPKQEVIQAMLAKTKAIKPEQPRLLFTQADIPVLKTKQAKAEGQAILKQLDVMLAKKPDPLFVGAYAAGYLFKFHLNPQRAFLDSAFAYIRFTLSDKYLLDLEDEEHEGQKKIPLWNTPYKAIYKGPNLIGLALAYDLGYTLMPDTLRTRLARQLEKKALEVIKGEGVGFNKHAWSNWQGIANGSGALALMAIAGDKNTSPNAKVWLDSALVRMVRHLDCLGDAGWSGEGLDYLRFEMCTGVLPLALSYKKMFGQPMPGSEKLDKLAQLYGLLTVKADSVVLAAGFGGGGNLWNTNAWRSGDWIMSFGLVHPEALLVGKAAFDQLFGLKGDRSFNLFKPYDAIYAMLYYPEKQVLLKPGNGPYYFVDKKAGLYLFRSTIGTGNDIVFSTTANLLARQKAHSYRDAGSYRLFAHGKVIAGRGNKSDKKGEDGSLENVVQVMGATNWNPAKVLNFECDQSSSMTLRLDMTPVYQAGTKVGEGKSLSVYEARRIIKLNFQPGHDVVVNITDSLSGGGVHCWRLHSGWRTWFNGSNRFRARHGGRPAFEGGVMEMCNPKEGLYQVMLRVEDE
jgi:hypothetical protein